MTNINTPAAGVARMQEAPPLVIIVDDDRMVREGLDNLFRSLGYATLCYGSAQEVLGAPMPDALACIVTDVRMPRTGGLEFQQMLADRGIDIPIVFITGYGDIPMTVRAMKAGAVDFLAKPFRDQDLLDAVNAALELARVRRSSSDEMRSVRQLYGTLTDREREIMQRVVKGLLNKEIAGELSIAEITVKAHRASLMRKMGVRRVPDLVRFAEMLARNDRD